MIRKESLIVLAFFLISISADELKPGEIRMGSYGYKCITPCEKKGDTDYLWCEGEHPTQHYKGDYYWDYCSLDEDHDYQGNRCYIEHACGNHGYKYKWCYLDEQRSSWGYCGFKVRNNRT